MCDAAADRDYYENWKYWYECDNGHICSTSHTPCVECGSDNFTKIIGRFETRKKPGLLGFLGDFEVLKFEKLSKAREQ